MNTYREEQDLLKIHKQREILAELPHFVSDFFIGINQSTTYTTQYAYAVDIRTFFYYLDEKQIFIKEVSDLDLITPRILDDYFFYLTAYSRNNKTFKNNLKAKNRKLATLRKFYEYYLKRGFIKTNPTLLIEKPKVRKKTIMRLSADEVVTLLDGTEKGVGLTDFQKEVYHEKVKLRDIAIITLLLGTGIRVSECVGIDLSNIDFKNNGLQITAKGQDERMVYFNEEVKIAIEEYLKERGEDKCPALFVVKKNDNTVSRIAVRTIQYIVQKYSQCVLGKHISPHKLRSSFATSLYEASGDIGLVSECLGHKDINTTKNYYAKVEDSQRKKAAALVNLRKE